MGVLVCVFAAVCPTLLLLGVHGTVKDEKGDVVSLQREGEGAMRLSVPLVLCPYMVQWNSNVIIRIFTQV